MFNKRPTFDRKNGETRICSVCSTSFHTMKPLNKCVPCTNAWNKQRLKEKIELGLIEKLEYKENYPFNTTNGESHNRFRRIQKALDKCNTREERREHYNKQLKEAEELGILAWIYDRRDNATKLEKAVKRDTKITKQYPDTRYMDWEEYERGGWGEPEDS
jgi:hypothetical protein